MMKILALGDCNTSGDVHYPGSAYPERLGKLLGAEVVNCGFTMSTTREMLAFLDEFLDQDTGVILVQYGLVDSWKTFRYAPYVPYYPDSRGRKLARKLVKKYKKIARQLGLNQLLGVGSVVPEAEYRQNLETLVAAAANRTVLLLDTIPNRDLERNPAIKTYNRVMGDIASQHDNCVSVAYYSEFEAHMDKYYLDETHMNDAGHDLVATRIADVLKRFDETNSATDG